MRGVEKEQNPHHLGLRREEFEREVACIFRKSSYLVCDLLHGCCVFLLSVPSELLFVRVKKGVEWEIS